MDVRAKKEIRTSLLSILEVSLFLVVTTWFWYGPRVWMQEKSMQARNAIAYTAGVSLQDDKSILIDSAHKSGEYTFSIKNDTDDAKDILVSLIMDYNKKKQDECEILAYNKVQYYLTLEDEQNFTPKSLSISGNILATTLQPGEERHYLLKYFVDNDLDTSKYHFHSKAMLSSGQNL